MKLDNIGSRFAVTRESMSLEEYLAKAKKDASYYASPFTRLLEAIGEPKIIDTSKDPALGQIFSNKNICTYDVFSDFYGMEEVIENIVSFLKHGSQGLEEKKQILYLLGPVGSAKSSLAERLKELMEKKPFYSLAIERNGSLEISPIFESPLGFFNHKDSKDLNIPERYLTNKISPWALKRLNEHSIEEFKVVKLYPSEANQISITKTEPGDDNNQDISSLVGKLDIRKLEHFSSDDPDAYRFNGGLCLGNRGLLEFVEMFKAPIKVLHPLLTATQEGNYKGTEALSAIPFDGIILAHSNEAEWQKFREDKNNEAFIDRIFIVKVPYCLRTDEEQKIYKKLLRGSSLAEASCAPNTLKILADFSVLTRLDKPENSSIYSKMDVYNGQNVKDKDPKVKSYQEYKDSSSLAEGFSGMSTRAAFKILSHVYNFDITEIGADPVHMFYILEKYIEKEDFSTSLKEEWLTFIREYLKPEYMKHIGKEIQIAYLNSYSEYGQHIFDKYITYADKWTDDKDYKDPDTGLLLDRGGLDDYLSSIEKPAGISNPKDFRNDIVKFVLRYRAKHKGNNPSWLSYNKMKEVIEKNLLDKTEDILPQISFELPEGSEEAKKNDDFMKRMLEKGYTQKQARRCVEWHTHYSKSK
jgi:serine protein kinase